MAKVSNVAPVATPVEVDSELLALTQVVSNMKSALVQERERSKQVRGVVVQQQADIKALLDSMAVLKKQGGALNLKVVQLSSSADSDRRTEWNDAVARLRERDGDAQAYYDPKDIRAEIARVKVPEVKAPMTPVVDEADVAF